MIETDSLSKVYNNGFKAVGNLNINVSDGDIYGFLGPNGAGKTTTIRMLDGLLSPSYGKAVINGKNVEEYPNEIKRIIGVAPESHGYYYWMNAKEYLMYFSALFASGNADEKYVDYLLKRVGLFEKRNVYIREFSRGMKQRLGIAKSLVNRPKIIFLDEPTIGLDPKGQKEVQELLQEINEENEITIFITSHLLKDIEVLCKNICILKNGKVAEQGSLEKLKYKYEKNRATFFETSDNESTKEALSTLAFISDVRIDGSTVLAEFIDEMDKEDALYARKCMISEILKYNIDIYSMQSDTASIEDIFFSATEKEGA